QGIADRLLAEPDQAPIALVLLAVEHERTLRAVGTVLTVGGEHRSTAEPRPAGLRPEYLRAELPLCRLYGSGALLQQRQKPRSQDHLLEASVPRLLERGEVGAKGLANRDALVVLAHLGCAIGVEQVAHPAAGDVIRVEPRVLSQPGVEVGQR